jgi:HEAT repeat protein
LDDPRPEIRREAILALGQIGETPAGLAPRLVKALDDEATCAAATYALGCLGNLPPEAEAKIRQNMQSPKKVLAATSVWAMAKTHLDDQALLREAVQSLVEGLKSPDPQERIAAAQALGSLKPSPEISRPILDKALQGADEATVTAALGALASLGAPMVPRLVDALQYEKLRPRVAYMLGQIGPAAKDAVPALVGLLHSSHRRTREEALMALAKIGPGAKAAVPDLAKLVTATGGPDAHGATFALGAIGRGAIDAEPPLLAALDSRDESLPLIAAWALVQIHPDSPQCTARVLPVLTAGLADPSPKFRREAARALAALGPQAKPAAAQLKKALQDADPDVRDSVAEALEAIGR